MICSVLSFLVAIGVGMLLKVLWQAEQRRKLAGVSVASPTVECRQSRRFAQCSLFRSFFASSFADGQSPDGLRQPSHCNTFQAFTDRFRSFGDVAIAMHRAGLQTCDLILGVDFTASNEWQGRRTFNAQCLHAVQLRGQNPYQRVITILGATLQPFSTTGRIAAFGFGDRRTKNAGVFNLNADGRFCDGFRHVLRCYNRALKSVILAGPTSFAPILKAAIDQTRQSGQFSILVIVSDGQIKPDEKETVDMLIEASNHPLAIVMVGVGDGDFSAMEHFDDFLPRRRFDNFQFVDFHKTISDKRNAEAAFALHALMEVPDQFSAVRQLGLLTTEGTAIPQ